MKERLMKLLKAKEEARQALVERSEKSENVEELRQIQAEITAINNEIEELRSMVEAAEQPAPTATPEDKDTDVRTAATGAEAEARAKSATFMPGKGFTVSPDGVARKAEIEEAEERGKALKEGRAVKLSGGIVLPKFTGTTVNKTFQQVSSLLDAVDVLPLSGGESYAQAYEKSNPDGEYTAEGAAAGDTDPVFGEADILKSKITSYSEVTEEVTKLSDIDYDSVITNGIATSVRKKLAKEIMVGDGTAGHLIGIFSAKATAIDASTDLSMKDIDNKTLDTIVFSYGGDESIEGQGVLILSKQDLKAFSMLRTTGGKKYHEIKFTSGGTGFIDTIPFIINSACLPLSATGTAENKYCMAYGNPLCYRLTNFSELEVTKSTEYKFKEGMIANKGVIFAGGNVVSYNGFIRVKKGK